MEDFYHILQIVLKEDGRFFTQEGKLLREAVYQASMQMDSRLIQALYRKPKLRERFFTQVDEVVVFDKVDFSRVISNWGFFPDSCTRYCNKIGLTGDGITMPSATDKVELVFPHKDCVLEGGQEREDRKHSEIFYDKALAPEKIDRLLKPKVLTNAVRYTRDACVPASSFSEEDNLVFKGDNLLCLASLLPRLEGKVKLIYIDPPYNTGSGAFTYNDSFSRSAWLVFMKNRLELALRLLREDGAIYVQLDYHQAHYAKVLMDEIFGEENFQREIIWRIGWVSGYKTREKNWIRNHDTILFYSKNRARLDFKKYDIPREAFKSIAQSQTDRYPIEDVWNGNEYDDLNSIAIVSFAGETVSKLLNRDDKVKGQKPEKLLERIIKAHTDPGDLVLDFFAGTGTTAAACMKLRRRFILCEQLDKHMDIILRRLQRVMEGEQSGISKRNQWKGGGSFVYAELMKLNQLYIKDVEAAGDGDTLASIWRNMQATGFVNSQVDPSEINSQAKNFTELSWENRKHFLLAMLDQNQLYVNLCDMDDESFAVPDESKLFTWAFYGKYRHSGFSY